MSFVIAAPEGVGLGSNGPRGPGLDFRRGLRPRRDMGIVAAA